MTEKTFVISMDEIFDCGFLSMGYCSVILNKDDDFINAKCIGHLWNRPENCPLIPVKQPKYCYTSDIYVKDEGE